MKLKSEDNIVLSNNTTSKGFTIAATAKAFKILSSSLYERKIEAIVRELSCNAYDSHVQAGCADRPFSIHLPTMWSPEFSVEDFGLGMDDDDVNNIYTSYFTSTKTDSNDVIGALGLGSKTPFSYTDTFTVRARKNGVERVYHIYISEVGEPTTSMVAEHPTDECNGVKVSVPVREKDFHEFEKSAKIVYKWFLVQPDFNTDLVVDNAMAHDLITSRVILTEFNKGGYEKNFITAVMGNVAYRINNVCDVFGTDFNSSQIQFFRNNGMYLHFDIGDLDVAASRESISFDVDTKEIFISTVKNAITHYVRDTQVKVDECKTIYEALLVVDREVGFWAYSLFTFMDVELDVLAEQNIYTTITNIDDHFNLGLDDERFIKNRNHTVIRGYIAHCSLSYTKSSSSGKIAILVGDKTGTVRAAREITAKHQTHFVIVVDCLTPAALAAFQLEFGEKRIRVYDTAQINARIKAEKAAYRAAEREKLLKYKKAQNPDFDEKELVVTERVKKSQIKVMAMIDIENVETYSSDTNVNIDVDKVGNRYMIFKQWYSAFEDSVSGREIAVAEIRFLRTIKKMFELDSIIVVKSGQLERTQKLLPNALSYKDEISSFDTLKKFDMELAEGGKEIIKAIDYHRTIIKSNSDIINQMFHTAIMSNPIIKELSDRLQLLDDDIMSCGSYIVNTITYTEDQFFTSCFKKLKAICDGVLYELYTKYPMLEYVDRCSSSDDEKVEEYIKIVDKSSCTVVLDSVKYKNVA